MPSELLRIRTGECVFLQVALPGRPVENAGVLLLDPETDQVHLRLRRDWDVIAGEDEVEVLELLADDLAAKARETGGRALLGYLSENLSHLLRVTDAETVQLSDFDARLNRLYQQHVAPSVLAFRTHLPLYSVRAAAGQFGGEMEAEPEGWVETPEGLRLAPDMFVAHITGHSMEPQIPDGSLCVFRRNPQGSRTGKWLLIENYSEGSTGRYTIKRYKSEKRFTEDGWEHTRIVLEPLNPAYDAWELEPGQFQVIGEFIRVMPPVE